MATTRVPRPPLPRCCRSARPGICARCDGGNGVGRYDQGRRLVARPPKVRARTASRVAAVQALFQAEQAGDNPETVIAQFVRHRLGDLEGQYGFEDGRIPDAEVPLFSRVVREAVRRQDTIDPMLVEALPADWPLSRIDPVLR